MSSRVSAEEAAAGFTFDQVAMVSRYLVRCRDHMEKQKQQKDDLMRSTSDLRLAYLRAQGESFSLAFENRCWGMFCFATEALHASKAHLRKALNEEATRRRAIAEVEPANAEIGRLRGKLADVEAQRQVALNSQRESQAQISSLQAEVAKLKKTAAQREEASSSNLSLMREQLQLRDATLDMLQKQNADLLGRLAELQAKSLRTSVAQQFEREGHSDGQQGSDAPMGGQGVNGRSPKPPWKSISATTPSREDAERARCRALAQSDVMGALLARELMMTSHSSTASPS